MKEPRFLMTIDDFWWMIIGNHFFSSCLNDEKSRISILMMNFDERKNADTSKSVLLWLKIYRNRRMVWEKKFIYLQHSISRLSGRMKTQTKCKLRWRWFFLTFPISVSGVITNMTSGIAPVLRNRISSITRTLIYMGIIKGQRKKGGRSDYQSQGLLAGSTLKSSSVSYTTETEESKSQQWFESPFDNWYT